MEFVIIDMSKLLKCVLQSYPKLDEEIAEYIGSMLDDGDLFESASDISEAVGPFLIDAADAKEDDVDILAIKLYNMMETKSVSTTGNSA